VDLDVLAGLEAGEEQVVLGAALSVLLSASPAGAVVTNTPTFTITNRPSLTSTRTFSASPTGTPSDTRTRSGTPTATATRTATETPTFTPIPGMPYVEYNESGLVGADPPVLENFRIIVDLSDTTNYRHTGTGAIELHHVASILGRSSSAATWEMFLGVVLATSVADVTVGYLEGGTANADGTDPTSRVTEDRDYTGAPLNVRVVAGDVLYGVIYEHTVETAITSASAIKTSRPGNPTANPAPGDLIMRVRKTLGAGTLRARQSILYRGIP
jgi:hypothetical protein